MHRECTVRDRADTGIKEEQTAAQDSFTISYMDKGYHSLQTKREQTNYFDMKNMEQKKSSLVLWKKKDTK